MPDGLRSMSNFQAQGARSMWSSLSVPSATNRAALSMESRCLSMCPMADEFVLAARVPLTAEQGPGTSHQYDSASSMKPDTRTITQLFELDVRYEVPLYQRPYVWEEKDQWDPLWDDVETLLDHQ